MSHKAKFEVVSQNCFVGQIGRQKMLLVQRQNGLCCEVRVNLKVQFVVPIVVASLLPRRPVQQVVVAIDVQLRPQRLVQQVVMMMAVKWAFEDSMLLHAECPSHGCRCAHLAGVALPAAR